MRSARAFGRHSPLLASLFFLFATGTDAAVQDGTWSGTTGTGGTYRVTTAANKVTQVEFSFSIGGCSGSMKSTMSATIDASNHFSANGGFCPTYSTSGTFDPAAGTATGTLSLTATYIPYACNCSGSSNTTWNAILGAAEISINDPSVVEGNVGKTLLAYDVKLSAASSKTVTVDFGTCGAGCSGGGTAQSGVDYTIKNGSVTFAPGQTSRSVLVEVFGNTTTDGNRTLKLNLGAATNAVIADSSGLGTIVDDDPAGLAPVANMYRLYADNLTYEHLYTTDLNEYNVLGAGYNPTTHVGWLQEGVGYKLLGNAGLYNGEFGIPLFRLYNTATRQHHWTTDSNEAATLAAWTDWNYEGIVGYVLPSATSATGVTPLYRLWDNGALHLWTTDANEKNVLSTQRGWTYEGTIGSVIP